jgi:hypothetical protein
MLWALGSDQSLGDAQVERLMEGIRSSPVVRFAAVVGAAVNAAATNEGVGRDDRSERKP